MKIHRARGRRARATHPSSEVRFCFETKMQNGKPTTTDVDSGRLRVKKTNRPLPRCADEDLGFGTVRARYSQAVGKEGGARPPIDLLSKTEWVTATDARLRRFVAKVKAIGGEMRRLTSVFAVASSRCVGYYGSHVED